jgi:hypothetical protein
METELLKASLYKHIKMTTNRLPLTCLFCLFCFVVKAQSLPKIQQLSLRAPANIKIDGKTTEWDNKFRAYNNATDIFYTLSNDDENLYLTVQAKYHDVVDNILRGGITLTINHSLKKKDPEHVAFTYPVLHDAEISDVANMFARKSIESREAKNTPIGVDDINALLKLRSKKIGIEGVKAVPDNEISVYNQENINAASLFNADLTYTYELAIPLKYLALPDNGTSAFSYQVKVNPPPEKQSSGHSAPPPPMMMEQLSTTDFWGEYTLAKP